jgi:hypothetical protein
VATHSPAATETTDRPGRPPATAGRWWLLGFALIAAVTLCRLPVVLDEVRASVNERIASGDLPDTDQRALAITIGVATALALYLTVTLVMVAVARRIEPRCRLPLIELGRWRIPGMLFVVVGIALAVQLSALALQTTAPRSEPLVWAAALAVSATAVVAARRHGAGRQAIVRLVACAVVVSLILLVL